MMGVSDKDLRAIALKYHVTEWPLSEFFDDHFSCYLLCKEKTGKDPQEWLNYFDTYRGKDTNGKIGWIDALKAVSIVVKYYENILEKNNQELEK